MAWTVDGLEYSTRKKLTIDNTKIDAALADFPVLVKLTDARFDWAKSNADGFDVRFTSSDGETLLKYERERHDGADYAEYWVKIPTVASASDTDFYIYYRTTDTADGADPTNVWDASFQGVWHMNQAVNAAQEDSTTNNRDLTVNGTTPTQVDAKIGKGIHLPGVNEYLSRASGDIGIANAWTIEMLFLMDANFGVTNGLFYAKAADSKNRIQLYGSATYNFEQRIWYSGGQGGYDYYNSNPAFVKDNWYHLAVTWDGTNFLGYQNGGAISFTTSGSAGTMANANRAISFMSLLAEGYYQHGVIDESRISSTNRTAAWVKASYNSEFDSLLTYGAEETPAVGVRRAAFMKFF